MFPWHWWKASKGWGIRYCILCRERQQAIYNSVSGQVEWEPVG
jgi:hypothetical protein